MTPTAMYWRSRPTSRQQPPPFPEPDRLVTLWQTDPNNGNRPAEPAPANFLDWRERASSFKWMAAIEPYSFDFTGGGEPEVFKDPW